MEKFADKGLAQQADPVGVAHVAVREDFALGEVVPVTHIEKRRGGTVNGERNPIMIAVNYLRARTNHGSNGAHGRTFTQNGLGIFGRERHDAA